MLEFRELTSTSDLDAAFVLRHRICVDELGWVPPQPGGRETDEWDDGALHVGAFDGDELVGYLRVVADSAERGTMTHRCFSALFAEPDPRPPVAVTADLSRVVIASGYRDHILQICVPLFHLARARSMTSGHLFWYLVSGMPQVGLLRRYFTDVQVLGCGPTSDGGRNCVVLLDLRSWGWPAAA